MLSWIRKIFTKQQWAVVKTFDIASQRGKESGKVYIHLCESNKGNRDISVSSTFPSASESIVLEYVKATELYNERIYRWLQGRYDPEIPRFQDIPEEDTAAALRGKI